MTSATSKAVAPKDLVQKGWDGMMTPKPTMSMNTIRQSTQSLRKRGLSRCVSGDVSGMGPCQRAGRAGDQAENARPVNSRPVKLCRAGWGERFHPGGNCTPSRTPVRTFCRGGFETLPYGLSTRPEIGTGFRIAG